VAGFSHERGAASTAASAPERTNPLLRHSYSGGLRTDENRAAAAQFLTQTQRVFGGAAAAGSRGLQASSSAFNQRNAAASAALGQGAPLGLRKSIDNGDLLRAKDQSAGAAASGEPAGKVTYRL
jgi:hypothetical protein